nr:hypothetical protein [Aureimonas sp. AU4]
MRQDEIISLKEAAYRTGKNEKTIRRWCKQDGIGRRSAPGAPWEISATALEAKRYGDCEALELLRVGSRDSPVVERYLVSLGLSV